MVLPRETRSRIYSTDNLVQQVTLAPNFDNMTDVQKITGAVPLSLPADPHGRRVEAGGRAAAQQAEGGVLQRGRGRAGRCRATSSGSCATGTTRAAHYVYALVLVQARRRARHAELRARPR